MLELGASPRTLGGLSCGRLFGLLVFAGLALVTGLAPPQALAQTDPQSLVGEWTGTWVATSERLAQGALNMTVTKVESNQVHGRFERDGWGKLPSARFDFVGTLEGDRLVFSGPGESVDLTISGKQMRVTGFIVLRLDISMTKIK